MTTGTKLVFITVTLSNWENLSVHLPTEIWWVDLKKQNKKQHTVAAGLDQLVFKEDAYVQKLFS